MIQLLLNLCLPRQTSLVYLLCQVPSLVLLCLQNISLPTLVELVYLLHQPVVIQVPLVQCHWYLLLLTLGIPYKICLIE